MKLEPVNLTTALASFDEVYSPRIVARVNDYDVRIAHARGEHVWHVHEDTDEFFLVLDGQFEVAMRDFGRYETTVLLREGRHIRRAQRHGAQAVVVRRVDPDVRAAGTVTTGDRHEGEIPDHVDSTTGHDL